MDFGEFFKMKRMEKRLTLRKFCIDNGFDPGNISKTERGLLAPPQTDGRLAEYAKALGLKKGSEDYVKFTDLAAAGNRTFAPKYISKTELLNKLPVLFRTLDNKKLTEDKLDSIIRYIEASHSSE